MRMGSNRSYISSAPKWLSGSCHPRRIEAGCDVHVFERSPRMTGTEGAGLWVQPEFASYMEAHGISAREAFGVTLGLYPIVTLENSYRI